MPYLNNVYYTNEKVLKWDSIRKHRWLIKDEKNIASQQKYAEKVNTWKAIKKVANISIKLFIKILDKMYYIRILNKKVI